MVTRDLESRSATTSIVVVDVGPSTSPSAAKGVDLSPCIQGHLDVIQDFVYCLVLPLHISR